MRPLGRHAPKDFAHVAAHPVAELGDPGLLLPTPVVAGTDWFTSFDPTAIVQGADGKYRVSITPGASVRGGHCYCLEPIGEPDTGLAWIFYNQGAEGACEGFGNSRAMTLLTGGNLYDAFWLYDDARREEGTFPEGEGSTNRATAEVLRRWGDHPAAADGSELKVDEPVIRRVPWRMGIPSKGIKSYHWATSVEQIRQALGYDASVGEFPLLNSWGKNDYPHRVYMPAETIDTLLTQGAEYTVLVPR